MSRAILMDIVSLLIPTTLNFTLETGKVITH